MLLGVKPRSIDNRRLLPKRDFPFRVCGVNPVRAPVLTHVGIGKRFFTLMFAKKEDI
jgi:hypothetical protein